MVRKLFFLLLFAVFFLIFGFALRIKFENPEGSIMRLISENAHLHQEYHYASTKEEANPYAQLSKVANEICIHIYPKPKTINQCVNTLTHGLSKSFDPHTAFYNPIETAERKVQDSNSFEGIGITVSKSKDTSTTMVGELLDGGAAESHGILPGDTILKIDNIPITQFESLTEITRAIRGKTGTRVNLTLKHKDSAEPFSVSVVRKKIQRSQLEGAILTHEGKYYGLIRAHRFGKDFANEMKNIVMGMMIAQQKISGLIINLSGNPGGSLYEVNNALDIFSDAESFILERHREGIDIVAGNPLAHIPGDITHGIPILVIVDGNSASASEIFSASMQHNGRALVYGNRTFGKGTIQNIISLPDGSEMRITIAEYLVGTQNDWIPIQCIGVIPDVEISPIDSTDKLPAECRLEGSIISAGSMQYPPAHTPFSVAHPKEYIAGIHMIDAYTQHVQTRVKKNN